MRTTDNLFYLLQVNVLLVDRSDQETLYPVIPGQNRSNASKVVVYMFLSYLLLFWQLECILSMHNVTVIAM